MKHDEPRLSRSHLTNMTGQEPGLGGGPHEPYGRYHLAGLEAPSVAGRSKALVVLAEADEGFAELLSLIAGSNGYDVHRTNSGRSALNLTRALAPNLLVASRRLYGFDGPELARRLRADLDPQVRGLPILLTDTHFNAQELDRTFLLGIDDFLAQPYEPGQMLRAWRRLIGQYLRPAPVMALLNEDDRVVQSAARYLCRQRPKGILQALSELELHPSREVREVVRVLFGQLSRESLA